MITRAQLRSARVRAADLIRSAGIVATDAEVSAIQVADFGLGRLEVEGAQILTFFATDRLSAKAIALFGWQMLPEHWHPPVGRDPGKEEVIRGVHGRAVVGLPGGGRFSHGRIPSGKESVYTCKREVVLDPGDQVVIAPGTAHWLQADQEGAVVYSFSTCVRDALDGFTDPEVVRETVVLD